MRQIRHGLFVAGVALSALGCAPRASGTSSRPRLSSSSPLPGSGASLDAAKPLVRAASAIDLSGLVAGDPAALAQIGRAVGDARIVMLGEPSHGDGEAIRAKAGLVRYLHERLGFDVLAFEADFYSITAGWPKARTPDDVRRFGRENVYSFWSASRAGDALWSYVAAQRVTAHPLEVTGFDIRHTGRLARTGLADEIRRRLNASSPGDGVEATALLETLEHLLRQEFAYKPPVPEQVRFIGALDRLARAWDANRTTEDSLWAQEARNLVAAARAAWQDGNRDHGMAENFIWLATQVYPGRKIIVWAHNNHVITDRRMFLEAPDSGIAAAVTLMRPSDRDSLAYFGDFVRRRFGAQLFSMATLSHMGSYSPVINPALQGYRDATTIARYATDFDSVRALAPTPSGSLEATLAADGRCAAFLDLRPFRGRREAVPTRALDYSYYGPQAMRYWDGYDAFLFLARTTGLNEDSAVCSTPP